MHTTQRLLVIGPRGLQHAEGGVERYATAVLPRLARRGFEVTVTCMKRFAPSSNYESVRILRVPTLAALKTDKHLYLAFSLAHAIRSRPDVIFLLGSASLLIVPLKLLGYRVFARCGSMDTLSRKWGSVARFIIWVSQTQYRFADGVVAVSDEIRLFLMTQHHVHDVVHIPNGLDKGETHVDRSDRVINLHMRYVLAVGRITQQKDYPTLIQAFRSLPQTDLTLVIAGSRDGSVTSGELDEIGDPRIRYLGFVERSVVEKLLKKASLFVNCSIKEGMSNALLEAIGAGVPVLASDIAANRELGLPLACYFSAGDASDLSAKIAEALWNPHRFIVPREPFPDWDAVADATGSVLRGDLAGGRGSRCVSATTKTPNS